MKSTTALATILSCLAIYGASAAEGMPELDGAWVSMACELRPQAGSEGVQPWYLKRSIVFAGERIDAHFVTYADPDCAVPLLELKFGDDVTVVGPSMVADRAENARSLPLWVTSWATIR